MKEYRYLFGPVPSRRFGRSLGIDLMPFKICCMDCVFCQLGRTTSKTLERGEFVPVREVIAELRDWLGSGARTDFLTLAGSGEPTLHSGFGEVIEFARRNSEFKVALLTNGTTMHIEDVRISAARAHVVKISLSAWNRSSMRRINRPCDAVRFDDMMAGMRAFRSIFNGELWMEIFIVPEMNDRPDQARRIAALAETVKPDRIQLNTAVRPAAEKRVAAVPRERLLKLAEIFGPNAEVIADFKPRRADTRVNGNMILAMLRRRPCTARQIADAFSMHLNEVSKHLGDLGRKGKIGRENKEGSDYYTALK